MKKKIVSLLLITMSVLFLAGCSLSIFTPPTYPPTPYTQPITVNPQASVDERVQQIAKDFVEAVVTVFVVDNQGKQISFGSGVGVHQDGFIVTNYHVAAQAIENPNSYSLKVYYHQETEGYNAQVVWSHYNLDLAIIKSENGALPFVVMEDRFIASPQQNRLAALEPVVAIGTPLDFELQNTVTLGYVSSASHRKSFADGNVYENLIQHTAPINHGNSGGALFDANGKLIGLNTLGNDNANSIFFAVPIYPVMLVIDKVVAGYENNTPYTTPRLGINAVDKFQAEYMQGVTFNQSGMLVTGVPEGPSSGKLQQNDIITALTIGGVKYDVEIRNDLIFALLHADSGQTITVTFKRNGTINTVNVILD